MSDFRLYKGGFWQPMDLSLAVGREVQDLGLLRQLRYRGSNTRHTQVDLRFESHTCRRVETILYNDWVHHSIDSGIY